MTFFQSFSPPILCYTFNTLLYNTYGRAGRKENKPVPELGLHNDGIHYSVLYLGERTDVGVPTFRVPPRHPKIPWKSHKRFTRKACAFISVTTTKEIFKRKPMRETYVFVCRTFLNLFLFLYVGLVVRLISDCLIDSRAVYDKTMFAMQPEHI